MNPEIYQMKKQLRAKLEVHIHKLIQAEQENNKEEVERHGRMIDVYKSELEALNFVRRPIKTGVL